MNNYVEGVSERIDLCLYVLPRLFFFLSKPVISFAHTIYFCNFTA